jgi:Dual specificity phosphatase, catalytic domain
MYRSKGWIWSIQIGIRKITIRSRETRPVRLHCSRSCSLPTSRHRFPLDLHASSNRCHGRLWTLIGRGGAVSRYFGSSSSLLQGVSRSASIVIAYLIRKRGMSFDTAITFDRQRRPCIKPNSGFVRCLREWERQLCPRLFFLKKCSMITSPHITTGGGDQQGSTPLTSSSFDIESELLYTGDQLQEKFRRWLSPPDPSTNHNTARKSHRKGTALWFTEGDTFRKWKATGSLLWIHVSYLFPPTPALLYSPMRPIA